jgi:hypothetical protein
LRGGSAWCFVCIAFSRNAGPHSLVACYSVFKDRAPPLDAEPSSVSSLECLAGVARTTGLRQGGRRIYLSHPGSSSANLRLSSPELHLTARGRCLDQPLPPVKHSTETFSAACLARGATSTPSPSIPSSTPAIFFRLRSSRGPTSLPPTGPSSTATSRCLRGARLLPLHRTSRQALRRFSFAFVARGGQPPAPYGPYNRPARSTCRAALRGGVF